MRTSPEKIVFENTMDVVDYVSLGMLPKRQDFDQVMIKLRTPDTAPRDPATGSAYISQDVLSYNESERELTAQILGRVYENRKKNQQKFLIAAGIVGAVLVGGHVGMICHRHSKDKDDDHGSMRFIDPTIECESVCINCESL